MEGTVRIQTTEVVGGLSEYSSSSWRICGEIGTVDIIPRKVVCKEFLGSSGYYYLCFVLFDGRARARTCAHSPHWLTPHIG